MIPGIGATLEVLFVDRLGERMLSAILTTVKPGYNIRILLGPESIFL